MPLHFYILYKVKSVRKYLWGGALDYFSMFVKWGFSDCKFASSGRIRVGHQWEQWVHFGGVYPYRSRGRSASAAIGCHIIKPGLIGYRNFPLTNSSRLGNAGIAIRWVWSEQYLRLIFVVSVSSDCTRGLLGKYRFCNKDY